MLSRLCQFISVQFMRDIERIERFCQFMSDSPSMEDSPSMLHAAAFITESQTIYTRDCNPCKLASDLKGTGCKVNPGPFQSDTQYSQ
jgi:hypothetical protein